MNLKFFIFLYYFLIFYNILIYAPSPPIPSSSPSPSVTNFNRSSRSPIKNSLKDILFPSLSKDIKNNDKNLSNYNLIKIIHNKFKNNKENNKKNHNSLINNEEYLLNNQNLLLKNQNFLLKNKIKFTLIEEEVIFMNISMMKILKIVEKFFLFSSTFIRIIGESFASLLSSILRGLSSFLSIFSTFFSSFSEKINYSIEKNSLKLKNSIEKLKNYDKNNLLDYIDDDEILYNITSYTSTSSNIFTDLDQISTYFNLTSTSSPLNTNFSSLSSSLSPYPSPTMTPYFNTSLVTLDSIPLFLYRSPLSPPTSILSSSSIDYCPFYLINYLDYYFMSSIPSLNHKFFPISSSPLGFSPYMNSPSNSLILKYINNPTFYNKSRLLFKLFLIRRLVKYKN